MSLSQTLPTMTKWILLLIVYILFIITIDILKYHYEDNPDLSQITPSPTKSPTESPTKIVNTMKIVGRNRGHSNKGSIRGIIRGSISNPICKILFPSSIIFLHHHKTGTILAKKIRTILIEYCGIKYRNSTRHYYHDFLLYVNFRNNNDNINNDNDLRLHFWRDPVLTIVSGFNYHMNCNEAWVSRNLSFKMLDAAAKVFNFETDIFKLYQMYLNLTWTFDIDAETDAIWRDRLNENQKSGLKIYSSGRPPWKAISIRMCYLYYLNLIVNLKRLKNYGDFYGFNINFDDTEIHKIYNIFQQNKRKTRKNFVIYNSINTWYSKRFKDKDTMKYGLFFEMIRYLFAVYPSVYHFHFNLNVDKDNALKMETWNNEFDKNLNIILDKLNLINTQENKEKLKMNGLSHMDINKERTKLYYMIKKHDPSLLKQKNLTRNLMERPRDNTHISKRQNVKRYIGKRQNVKRYIGSRQIGKRHNGKKPIEHIHIDRNDTMFVDALLTIDNNICLLLKHLTNVIEYGWSYSNYC